MDTFTDRQEKLLNEKPSVLFFKLSVPGIIGMLVFGFYQFVDGVFVGQFVGPEGMGAVGLVYPFSLLNNGISGLIGTGAASIVSRSIGSGDNSILRRVFPAILLLNLIICAALTAVSIVFAPQFVSFMGGEGEMLDLGIQYMRVVVAGTFFINFAASSNMLIRSEGMIRQAMLILGAGAVLNLVLDPVLIIGFNMGIRGAAAATVISQALSMILSLLFLHSEKSLVHVSLSFRLINPEMIKKILSIGFSALALPLMAIIEIVTAYKMLDLFAVQNDVIALGTIFKIFSLLLPPVWGIAQGMQPFIGVNYGAGKTIRLLKGYATFTAYATFFTLFFWSMLIFAPRLVTSWFITEPLILKEIYNAPRIFFCMYPLYGFMFNTLILLQATGAAKRAAVFVTCRMVIYFIPVMLVICPLFGAIGVWTANPVADILTTLTAAIALNGQLKKLKLDQVYE